MNLPLPPRTCKKCEKKRCCDNGRLKKLVFFFKLFLLLFSDITSRKWSVGVEVGFEGGGGRSEGISCYYCTHYTCTSRKVQHIFIFFHPMTRCDGFMERTHTHRAFSHTKTQDEKTRNKRQIKKLRRREYLLCKPQQAPYFTH